MIRYSWDGRHSLTRYFIWNGRISDIFGNEFKIPILHDVYVYWKYLVKIQHCLDPKCMDDLENKWLKSFWLHICFAFHHRRWFCFSVKIIAMNCVLNWFNDKLAAKRKLVVCSTYIIRWACSHFYMCSWISVLESVK